MQFKLIFILVASLSVAVFILQNHFIVQLKFMGLNFGQMPVTVIVLISIIAGVVVSLLMGKAITAESRKKRKLEVIK